MAKKESRPQLVWMERPPDNVLNPQSPEDERAQWQYTLDWANALRASAGVPPLPYSTPEESREWDVTEARVRKAAREAYERDHPYQRPDWEDDLEAKYRVPHTGAPRARVWLVDRTRALPGQPRAEFLADRAKMRKEWARREAHWAAVRAAEKAAVDEVADRLRAERGIVWTMPAADDEEE
jgi:hypothetical protein